MLQLMICRGSILVPDIWLCCILVLYHTTLAKESLKNKCKQNWTIDSRETSRPKRQNWAWEMVTMIYSIYTAVLHAMNTSFLFEDLFGYFCLIFHSALMLLTSPMAGLINPIPQTESSLPRQVESNDIERSSY